MLKQNTKPWDYFSLYNFPLCEWKMSMQRCKRLYKYENTFSAKKLYQKFGITKFQHSLFCSIATTRIIATVSSICNGCANHLLNYFQVTAASLFAISAQIQAFLCVWVREMVWMWSIFNSTEFNFHKICKSVSHSLISFELWIKESTPINVKVILVYSSIHPFIHWDAFVCLYAAAIESIQIQRKLITNFYHQLIDFWSFVAVIEKHAIERPSTIGDDHDGVNKVCTGLFVCNKSPNPLFPLWTFHFCTDSKVIFSSPRKWLWTLFPFKLIH